MTQPQMERRVYQHDEPELFEQLVFASVLEREADGVRYHIMRGGDDTAGVYYLLTSQGVAQDETA